MMTAALETARPVAARARALRLMSSVHRPVTGGEILGYALSTWHADGVKAVMDGMAADGLVTVTGSYHPCARGRRTWTYRLAEPVGEGGEA
jgi:hypothetical protein